MSDSASFAFFHYSVDCSTFICFQSASFEICLITELQHRNGGSIGQRSVISFGVVLFHVLHLYTSVDWILLWKILSSVLLLSTVGLQIGYSLVDLIFNIAFAPQPTTKVTKKKWLDSFYLHVVFQDCLFMLSSSALSCLFACHLVFLQVDL